MIQFKKGNAIFLGSFNPPHLGHYDCLKTVVESSLIDDLDIRRIHVIPCWKNPNKKNLVEFSHRIEMCQKMFKSLTEEKVCVDGIEEEIKPTYTYELINYIKSGEDMFIEKDFWWIITYETICELLDGKWKRSEELLNENKFIVLGTEKELDYLSEFIGFADVNAEFAILESTNKFHSTELREKIRNGQSVEPETNEDVWNYIQDNNLYDYNMDRTQEYVAGDFLYGIPSSQESAKYHPEDERVFIYNGHISGDGYGKLIGFEDHKLVHSTGFNNFCWGGDVRKATLDEINIFISKIHNADNIPYRR